MGRRGGLGPIAMSGGCGHGTDYFPGPAPVFAGGSRASGVTWGTTSLLCPCSDAPLLVICFSF